MNLSQAAFTNNLGHLHTYLGLLFFFIFTSLIVVEKNYFLNKYASKPLQLKSTISYSQKEFKITTNISKIYIQH